MTLLIKLRRILTRIDASGTEKIKVNQIQRILRIMAI